jgi:hypothetical protein
MGSDYGSGEESEAAEVGFGPADGGNRLRKKVLRRMLRLGRPVLGGIFGRRAPGRKNPLPVTNLRRGPQRTRRLDSFPHGALTSRAVSPSQCSSLQGLLPHRSSDQEALGLHPQLYIFLYVTQLRDCQEQLGRF